MNQRQWYIVSGAIILMIFFILYEDIFPKILFLQNRKQQALFLKNQIEYEKKLIYNQVSIGDQMNQLKKYILPYFRKNQSIVAAELLETLMKTAEVYGLTIQSIKPMTWQSQLDMNELMIHAVITGSFLQWVAWVEILTHYSLPILLTDFTVQILQDNQVTVDMQIGGFYVETASIAPPIAKKWRLLKEVHSNITRHDPFIDVTADLHELSNQEKDNGLHRISLKQIKWVGYMREKNKFWSLALLPNGRTIAVSLNMEIGIEKGRIIRLNENEIVIATLNHTMIQGYTI